MASVRELFPQLQEKVYGRQLVYLDNAATALRPQSVVDKWTDLVLHHNANIHRAVHKISSDATDEFENTRIFVKDYLNADNKEEIIFTSGATEGINLVARTFGDNSIGKEDEIIIAESEHHSNIVPWQLLCERTGAKIVVLGVDDNGQLNIEDLEKIISERTRLLCVAQVSNVLGLINPIKEIVEIAHSRNVPVLVDGAQGVVHCDVDVKHMDCDFYAFSGHKLYAATGTGVLYSKKKWLEKMPPFLGGGEMIESVSWERTTYASSPGKFEAGTQNFNSIPTLIPAIQTDKMMKSPVYSGELEKIKNFVYETLSRDRRITLYGKTNDLSEKTPIFSFTVAGCHHEDLALIMDKMGIALRSGQMCAEPLMNRFKVTGMLRASFSPYNTMEEAEYFIKSLYKAISMLA